METTLRSGYDELFRGSTRLGLLAGSLGISWTATIPFIEAFAGELSDYQELSVDGAMSRQGDSGPGLGLMTRGNGKDFVFRIARFMECINHQGNADHPADEFAVDETALRRFLVRARVFEHRNVYIKIELDRCGVRDVSYYIRARPRLEVVHAWLADAGVDVQGRERVTACAHALNKSAGHFLACSLHRRREALDKVYFSQPDDPGAWTRVRDAAGTWGVPAAQWSAVESHRRVLARRPLFFSIGFHRAKPVPGIKLDVHRLPADATLELLGRLPGATRPAAAERFALLRSLFDQEHHDYVGIRLDARRPEWTDRDTMEGSLPIAVRAYCYRGA